MGIFDLIARKVAKPAASTIPALSFDGDTERRVFVCDASALPRLRKGQTFRADVLGNDVTIKDMAGATMRTKGMSAALAYKGRVFGSTSTSLECLKELAHTGHPVSALVEYGGARPNGIPELFTLTESPRSIRRWWLDCQALGEVVPFDGWEGSIFEFNLEEDEAAGISDGPVEFSLEYIPWKSANAKSPMTIAVMVDGEQIKKIPAGRRIYEEASSHAGKRPSLAVAKRLPSIKVEGEYFWKLIAYYGGE